MYDDVDERRRAVDSEAGLTPNDPPSSSVSKQHGGDDSRATAHLGEEDGSGAQVTMGRVGEIHGHGRRHEDKTRHRQEAVKSGHVEKTQK